MADGRLEKMEVDYSSTVDEVLPTVKEMCENGKLEEALDKLTALEKQTRSASDAISTGRILECMVQLCADKNEWKLLNEHLVMATKKRGQLKQAVTKMVQKACTYIDNTPDKPTKLELLDTLRTVTAGKIYVEVERAHLTQTLAHIREEEGNISEAATILQELQVETFGSMAKKEKIEFILEQMRLCNAKKDYIRTQIISKKVSTKFFQEAGTEELKLKYYNLMIALDAHEGAYLSISKHYKEIYNTPGIQEDEEKRFKALRHAVVYCLLAPFDNDQSDLMHRYKTLRDMEKIPVFLKLVQCFTTRELLRWKEFCDEFASTLRSETDIFGPASPDNEVGQKRWTDLHSRLIEHNIRVMAAYYTRIRLARMAQLLDLDKEKSEEFLSRLVVNKTVQAKIDRLEGVVHFTETKLPTDTLNDWSHNINCLMTLISKTNHLINKEKMIHQV